MRFPIILGLLAVATPVPAVEMPYIDYNGALDHARTTGRMVKDAQQRQQASATTAARARATCANKKQVAARLTPAKARHLYSLCARAGY